MNFLYSVRLEDEIGKFRRQGGRNLNFSCWADDTDLILEFLMKASFMKQWLVHFCVEFFLGKDRHIFK